jgi:phage N-6-adenine-methyltransferase
MSSRRCAACKEPLERKPNGRPRLTCDGACRQALYRRRNRRLRGSREVLGSSRSDEWPTDPAFFAKLEQRFGPFDLDPCATAETAKCPRYFTKADDGLRKVWTGRVFVNPPYTRGQIAVWLQKAWQASQTTADLVVCLVPSRTDTAWWHDWATLGEIEHIRGRLKFGPCTNSAPFPSSLVVFRNGFGVTKQSQEAA